MKDKIALAINTLIIIGESIAQPMIFIPRGIAAAQYYTQLSNIMLFIAAIILEVFLLRKIIKKTTIPRWVGLTLFSAVAATTVTIVVVLTILSWQVGDLGWLLFNGSMFFTHTLCPILGIILFTVFNPCEFKKTDARYAMIFTLGYAAVALVLNIAKIWHGPYPFLWVYEQPIWASVMWVIVILAGAFGLAKLLLLPNVKR